MHNHREKPIFYTTGNHSRVWNELFYMGAKKTLKNIFRFQSPNDKLWSPKIFAWKCTFWTSLWIPESKDRAVLCMCQALFFAFESEHWTLNIIKTSICPLVCWKFQPRKHQSRSVAHKPPCCYRATFLVPVPWRQCGPGVRALALRSGDLGFKTRSDHSMNLILVVPGSTSQPHL